MKKELTNYWKHYALLLIIIGLVIEAILWQPLSYFIAAFYLAVWIIVSDHQVQYCDIHFHPTIRKKCLLRLGSLFYIDLYKIYKVDSELMHDHASNFMMILLKGQFLEYTPIANKNIKSGDIFHHDVLRDVVVVSRAYIAGNILFRKSTYIHRLETMRNKTAICLCISFRKGRDWGYVVPDQGWVSHTKIDVTLKCE